MATKPKGTRYAEGTSVSMAKSREEIERLLSRYGATSFMYGTDANTAAIAFEMSGRRIRFSLKYPTLQSFAYTRNNVERTTATQKAAYDQEIRRLWRSLTMIIKAKLEAIEAGVTTLEEEFLAQTMMPNNQTVAEWFEPQIDQIYRSGMMPPLLPVAGQSHASKNVVEGQFKETK